MSPIFTNSRAIWPSRAVGSLGGTSACVAMAARLPTSRDAAYHEVVECRGRIGLRPQAYAARSKAPVAGIEEERAVEPALDVVAGDDRAHRVPLPERRRLDPGALEHGAAAIVVVEPEVVLQRIRA